jgi:heat shock protein HtpX
VPRRLTVSPVEASSMRIDPEAVINHERQNLLHSLLLVLAMGVLLLFLGYLIWGPWGALFVTALGLVLVLLGPQVSPRMVLRMYGARAVGPHELADLQHIVRLLAERAGLPAVPRLYYVPTRLMNAFSVGQPPGAAIGLTDGLLRQMTARELVGVLAHEVSHIRHNDMWVMNLADLISRITSSLSLMGQLLVIVNLPLALLGYVRFAWIPILLLLAAPTVSTLMQLALSRTREFDADLGAVRLTGDPVGLASALQKLERSQRGPLDLLLPGRREPEPSVLRTHPNTRQRVDRLLELAGRPPAEPPLIDPERLAREVSIDRPRVTRWPRWHVTGLWH